MPEVTKEMREIATKAIEATGWNKYCSGGCNGRAISNLLHDAYAAASDAGFGTDYSNQWPPVVLLLQWLVHLAMNARFKEVAGTNPQLSDKEITRMGLGGWTRPLDYAAEAKLARDVEDIAKG